MLLIIIFFLYFSLICSTWKFSHWEECFKGVSFFLKIFFHEKKMNKERLSYKGIVEQRQKSLTLNRKLPFLKIIHGEKVKFFQYCYATIKNKIGFFHKFNIVQHYAIN